MGLTNSVYLVTPNYLRTKKKFMKKLFFILFAFSLVIALSNCNGDSPPPSSFDPEDSISRTTALAMYAHYMDSTVNKSDTAIIRQIYPPVSSLAQMLKTKDLVKINFMVAAYLDTDSIVSRRNKAMILLQLKTEKGGIITYSYYDLGTATKEVSIESPYCPPPPCGPEW